MNRVSSYIRGHEIYCDYIISEQGNSSGPWKYSDNDSVIDGDERPCKRCGEFPTSEGHDACMGYIEGMKSVCCGHGVSEPIMMKKKKRRKG